LRILFDNSTPRGLASALRPHSVVEARALGWDRLTNGELLRAAEGAGFEVLVIADQTIWYQQNLAASACKRYLSWFRSQALVEAQIPEQAQRLGISTEDVIAKVMLKGVLFTSSKGIVLYRTTSTRG